jgi:hypothetical protein
MYWIASHTVTVDGSVGPNFTNIPQEYSHLQLKISARHTNANAYENMYARFNNDATAIYNGHFLYADGANVGSSSYTGYDAWEIGVCAGASTPANNFSVTIADILDYSSTSKFKTMKVSTGYDSNGGGVIGLKSTLYRTTNAITSLYISYPPFKAGTRFDLYGLTSSPETGA